MMILAGGLLIKVVFVGHERFRHVILGVEFGF